LCTFVGGNSYECNNRHEFDCNFALTGNRKDLTIEMPVETEKAQPGLAGRKFVDDGGILPETEKVRNFLGGGGIISRNGMHATFSTTPNPAIVFPTLKVGESSAPAPPALRQVAREVLEDLLLPPRIHCNGGWPGFEEQIRGIPGNLRQHAPSDPPESSACMQVSWFRHLQILQILQLPHQVALEELEGPFPVAHRGCLS